MSYLTLSLSENDGGENQTAQHTRTEHHADGESQECFQRNELLCFADAAFTVFIAMRTSARTTYARVIAATRFHLMPIESL